MNALHLTMLTAMLDNRQTTRTEIRGRRVNKKGWVESKVEVLVPTLAGNISSLNVDRAAKGWVPA